MSRVRNPDRGQFAGAEQRRQGRRVAPVGLDMAARPHRHHRGRDDLAIMAEGPDLPVQPVPCRAGLVTKGQPRMASRQLVDQLANRLRSVGNGAEEPHLATPSALRQCHRDRLLARVESHVGRILLHGSSPMPEALIGIARSTLDAGMQRDEPLAPSRDMASQAGNFGGLDHGVGVLARRPAMGGD